MQDIECWGKKVLSMEKGKGKWQKMCGREETEVEDEVWGKSIEVERDLVGKGKFLLMEAASYHETCTEKYIKKKLLWNIPSLYKLTCTANYI